MFLLVGTREQASPRYRVIQFVDELQRQGFEVELRYPEKKRKGVMRAYGNYVEQQRVLDKVNLFDIVFIQKRLFPVSFINKLAKSDVKIVFDFDDAIFSSQNNKSLISSIRTDKRFKAVCKYSNLVLAGNQYLFDHAVKAGGKQVKVFPTVIDGKRYETIRRRNETDQVILGWIGQTVNYDYLRSIEPVLSSLSDDHMVKLKVISRPPFEMKGVCVEVIEWSEDEEINELAMIDIGLMPIPDNEWAKGKCALKAIQYMAAGVPVVCSDVGANREVVRDQVDGFLVSNDSEWKFAIENLIKDRALRRQIGESGRERALSVFNLSCVASTLGRWLDELK